MLYDIYLHTMQHTTENLMEGVQYADETVVFNTDKDLTSAIKTN